MDPRFRWEEGTETLETLADDVLARVRIAIPVKLVEDSDGHTVKLQSLVKAVRRGPDGKLEQISLPPLSDVPIQHGGGGGVTLTHAHKRGDEGIYLFSHRSLDAWWQQGGEQPQVDARMVSHSDGFYLSNVRSTPRKLENVSTSSTQMRSDDGKHMVDLHPQKGITHSVEGGKHVVSILKDNGITHSADNGKHVVSLSGAGISLKTVTKLAMQAADGMDLKGALKVDGKLTSTQPIGGSVLAGVLGGGIGALMGMMITAALLASPMAQTPGTGFHTARYALASLWGQP